MSHDALPPQVIAFTGLPGTGKSTMAERLARTIKAPVFAGDWLMGALKPLAGALAGLDRSSYLALNNNLLETLVLRQLLLGQSAITDCLLDDATAAKWQRTAADHGASLIVIECVCTDTDLHRSRIEGRVRGIPGWHEIDWAHVERMRTEFPPLTVERITIDGVDPLDQNLQTVLGHLDDSKVSPR